LDPYSTFFYLDWVTADIPSKRFAQRLAVANIEPALMQRALDFMAFQKAIAKAGVPMRTDVIGGENFALDVIQGQILALRVHTNDVVLGYFVGRRYIKPIAHVLP